MKKTALVSALLLEITAHAAVINVDNQTCTLADAIESANQEIAVIDCSAGSGADEINLPAGSTITLTSALPNVDSEITLNCQDSTITRDEMSPGFTLLTADYGSSLTLNDCTMTKGGGNQPVRGDFGGGLEAGALYGQYASVNINRSTFSDNDNGAIKLYNSNGYINDTLITNNRSESNYNRGYGGGNAAGLSLLGTNVTISRSTISGNTALGYASDGAMFLTNTYNYSADVDVINTTISNNTAGRNGGAINMQSYYNPFGGGNAELTLSSVTLANNSAGQNGGGIFNQNSELSLRRTLVSGNTAGNLGNEIFATDVYSTNLNRYNLIDLDGDDGTFGVIFDQGTSDGIIQEAALSSVLDLNLKDNGGLTPTHALVLGSPAIDFFHDAACVENEDQTGAPRPIAGGANPPGCDVGAYEFRDLIFRNGFD
ncbi:hypothetical protein OS175_07665 [Marinicella sp. S1101]|uniref:choice-of-anchor Q domain-containing protein n=1 Tax=Marinicella marina TaxID=2996016 RepID=UPI002260CA78|nr:choice-of-anchor Q domain-containing protein [Marinicella marina]MCX7553752.1 hypothetical protein [Marinicella marina]MDJ1140827.1 choice-of-anchor Q domain-containing protein [Marinicella marina]